MARKISNEALKSVLTASKNILEAHIKHHRWMASKVWAAVNFGNDTLRRDKEIGDSIGEVEAAARTSRDIDHALAALDQETDDV